MAKPPELRILLDCRYVRRDGRHDGISRYSAGIATALGRLHPVTMLISDSRQLELLPDLPWQQISAPTSALEPFVARQVNRLRPDVVFSPMQTMGSFGRRYRLVLTVHDLIYYRHRTPPREFSAPIRLLWRLYHLAWWPQRLLLNRADAVVTVSETTKQLIAAHRLTRRPVTVVTNAADEGAELAGAAVPSAPEAARSRNLLYMGSFLPYKNVETLVRGMALLPEYTLHLLSPILRSDHDRLADLAPAGRVVFHGGVTEAEYRALLGGAAALVSASLDEGFGLPLVESMNAGTPVLISDIPIFREIGGEAAGYFSATDESAFADAVRDLERPGEWSRRSQLGVAQASTFSWDRSAEALLQLLRRVAG